MNTWPLKPSFLAPKQTYTTFDIAAGSIGCIATTSSALMTTASQAIFWPIMVSNTCQVTSFFLCNGAAVAGNIDLGLYDRNGTKLSSTGSTAQAGVSTLQEITVTAFNINPGLYFMAVVLDDATTAQITGRALGVASHGRVMGLCQMAAAFPLPATATFATITDLMVPYAGFRASAIDNQVAIQPATIHTWHPLSLGPAMQATGSSMVSSVTSAAFPAANRALYFPFCVPSTLTLTQLFTHNGATASGNIDIGIYTSSGVRLVSAGSTAQAGTSALQLFNVTDTELAPGQYYLAVALDNATGTLLRVSHTLGALIGSGCKQQASAFPLPATATFATVASQYIPTIGLTTQAVI